ncbi:MAG: hypothetical protein Q9225_006832 [Loekoesia sp. 1 TL-2023]
MPKYSVTVSSADQAPSLPILPPELRERIYNELFHEQPSSLFNLLTVSRRISSEVRPWIFKLPVTFNGQQNLFRWLSRVDLGFLRYVTTVRFKLHDIDPDKIVGALGERLRRAKLQKKPQDFGNPYREACQLEISRVLAALKTFKSLRSLTILDSTSADPRPPLNLTRELVDHILVELPLISFNVPHSLLHNTDSRSNEIKRFKLTDYSVVGSPGFPRDLARFSQMSVLQICSSSWSESLDVHKRKKPIYIHENLPNLQELTMCLHEADERYSSELVVYKAFERHMITLAENATPLKIFRLWCNNWVGHTTSPVQTLLRFFNSSSLTHIDTGYWWSPLPNEYPSSIVTISVRFDMNYRMFPNWTQKFFDAINPKQTKFFTNHPHLKEILAYLPPRAQDDLKRVKTRRSAVAAICKEHGIKLRVIYEDFSCNGHD